MKDNDWTRAIPSNVTKVAIRYEIVAKNPNGRTYVHNHGTQEEVDREMSAMSYPENYGVRRVVTVTHVDIA